MSNRSASGFDFGLIWRRKWSILVATLITVALGVAYLLVTTPVFEVRTRLLVQKRVAGNDANQNQRWEREFVATQAEVIRSPLILRVALAQAPITLAPDTEADAVKYVLERLIVAPVVQTDVLSIQFRSASPEESANFVKAVVASYEKHLQDIDTHANSESLILLSRREEELRDKLRQLDDQHIKLRKNSPLIGQSKDIVNVHSAMLSQLAQKLTDSRLRRIELDSRLQTLAMTQREDLTHVPGDSLGQPVALLSSTAWNSTATLAYDPGSRNLVIAHLMRDGQDLEAKNIIEIEQQLQLAEVRRQQFGEKYGARHTEMKLAAAEVNEWESMLDERLAATIEAVQRGVEVEQRAEERLTKLYETEHAGVKALDDYLLKDEKMRVEIARTEEIYDTVLARLSEVKLSEQAVASGQRSIVVRDLEGPDLKAKIYWPQPKKFLALCTVVGLIGGVLMSLGWEAFRGETISGPPRDES